MLDTMPSKLLQEFRLRDHRDTIVAAEDSVDVACEGVQLNDRLASVDRKGTGDSAGQPAKGEDGVLLHFSRIWVLEGLILDRVRSE